MVRFKYLTLLILLSSCAGYRTVDNDNPLAQYGINSVYIPMFYNQTILPGVASKFTNEFFKMMSQFKSLDVVKNPDLADAVLVGIVGSSRDMSTVKTITGRRLAKSGMPENIGDNRNDFSIPSSTQVNLVVRIVLIKNPTKELVKLIQSELGEKIDFGSKVIFDQSIAVASGFSHEYYRLQGVEVVGSQNRGSQKRSVDTMAIQAASSFKNMVLYVF